MSEFLSPEQILPSPTSTASGKEPASQCKRHKRCAFDPWVGKISWRRAWQPTPVLPGESHGRRSLGGCSPWGIQESDMTKVTEHMNHLYTSTREETPNHRTPFSRGFCSYIPPHWAPTTTMPFHLLSPLRFTPKSIHHVIVHLVFCGTGMLYKERVVSQGKSVADFA